MNIDTSSLILQLTTAPRLLSSPHVNIYCIHLFSEDILSSPEALWGSPDGTHIMYASFNDSEVRILAFPWFGSASISGSLKGVSSMWTTFPESRTVRYPTVSYGNRAVLTVRCRFYTQIFHHYYLFKYNKCVILLAQPSLLFIYNDYDANQYFLL